ncbi:MAG: hypothetical protein IPF79_09185 [Ignavibacteria bacterium]|nr:hypothetical protein [Ignavibacteria bacterium]
MSKDGDFKGMNKEVMDIFVIKLDKDGDVLWKKTFGGQRDDRGYFITTTSDNGVLITGVTESNDDDFEGMSKGMHDIFVIKLDKDGEVLWKKIFGGSGPEQGFCITTTSDSCVLITGVTMSNDNDFDGMNKWSQDIFVIKLDKDGETLWKKTIGGRAGEEGFSITTTSDNGVLITGYTSSNDGDFGGMNNGGFEIVLIKLDKDGKTLWKKTFGGKDGEWSNSITTTSDNGVLITGVTESNDGTFKGMKKGGEGIFVIKLDSNGSFNPTTTITNVIPITPSLFVSPNPLSISSMVMFTTGSPSVVRIELLNTLGESVGVIYDGFVESGEHRIQLNISNVSPGSHYLRMTSEGTVNSTQVVVLR